jgi:hypothetical protein
MDIHSQTQKTGLLNHIRSQTAIKVRELTALQNPGVSPNLDFVNLLSYLFDLGGIISGGAVLSVIHNKYIKDVDFYFNNERAYINARYAAIKQPKIDICWYFNQPYELHDLSFVMSTMTRDGIKISEAAQTAFDTGISELYLNHVIYPDRTAKRMIKYNRRYGVKFKLHQILMFCSVFKIPENVTKILLSISTS